MQISEEILEKIKQENDIVEVVSDKVRLKRSGRNFMGLCPFHNEKSPSFSVSQDKQIYKCFGCGEAGNVISFVMKDKNMPFLDAVKYLADRANIPLETEKKGNNKAIEKKELLYKINSESGKFFFSNLMKNNNAKDYFLNRGIKVETIKRFGLGYANDSWNSLMSYLKRLGVSEKLMEEAGLISVNAEKGKKYDRFRNRVMFPVFDYRGKVIGFGGRVLDDSKPKYLNSPETLVFQKGTNLYGLNFALKHNMNERYFIVVEGYMDLITLHQYGITNVVASLGTALTINQARLLKRYADKVIISYDADMAGQMATLRGLEVLRTAGFDVRVLSIPQGKDPDEFVRSNGKEAFMKLINNAEPLIDYRLKKAEDGINFKDSQSAIIYAKKIINIINDLDPFEKDIYIKKASENTGINEQRFYDVLNRNTHRENEDNNFERQESREKLFIEPAFLKAERSLLKLILQNYEYFPIIEERISENSLILPEHKQIFTIIKTGIGENKDNIISFVESQLNDTATIKEFTILKEFNIAKAEDTKKLIKECIDSINKYKLQQKLQDLKRKQKALMSENRIDESIQLAGEIAKVSKELKS